MTGPRICCNAYGVSTNSSGIPVSIPAISRISTFALTKIFASTQTSVLTLIKALILVQTPASASSSLNIYTDQDL